MVERGLPVVQTAGLCKTFRDFWRRGRVEAVKDLDMEIQPGEVFGLLGPNGSGKTTTIKMLLGLLFPTRGRISLFGKAPTDVAVKARVGFLPEESYLYRFLSARETLDHFGRLFCIPARIRRERTDLLLDMVGLRHEANRPVGEYSKGMARRIGLAQALINDPEFLILDEPTSGLDPIGARQIKDVIRELGEKGKTILLSSHMLADVEDVCDRVVILYGGCVRASGNIGDLLAQRNRTQITTTALSDNTIEKVEALIQREEQATTLDVTHPRDRLEDFFLRIVHEAQIANIHTSGARAGGVVPTFLAKATDTTTDEVLEELLTAAVPKPRDARAPADQAPAEPPEEPSRPVIAELLGAAVEPDPPAREPTALAPTPLETNADGDRPAIQADAEVIDDLLGHAPDRTARDKREDQP